MIIKNVVFKTSVKDARTAALPPLPEIAIAGKSNVGKSSLINYLANYSGLAYVSKKPGKTRLINYFECNRAFYLVDLPGYGFARAPKQEQESWADMVEGYFNTTRTLRLLLVLMDIRHPPSAGDVQMIEWARHYQVPFAVIATKADKIAKSKRKNSLTHLKKLLDLPGDTPMAALSSLHKTGQEELLLILEKYLV